MTANPNKTPAINLRRRFTLSTSFRQKTGRACDACRLSHTREYGAIAMWVQPRTAASFAEITPAANQARFNTFDFRSPPVHRVDSNA
jgi:hypothetical protein